MKANPGGIVSPDDVVGRDRLIARVWNSLEQQSLVMVAERRMGKTTVIKKMEAEPHPGVQVFYRDVGSISQAHEFVERLAQTLATQLDPTRKATKWLNDLWSALGGIEVAGILKFPESKSPHWKTALERLLGELVRNSNHRRILIWDELPWMLQKIARNEGQAVVVDLLDVLRAMRQTHDKLRLVYTGSIGLHHVVTALQDEGYANSPINDMRILEVPPLEKPDAVRLADELLHGEGLATNGEAVAECIAGLVEGVPYYIHHVIATLADIGAPATPTAAEAAVGRALTESQDPWNLEHYRSRLRAYYGGRAGIARAVLDAFAHAEVLGLNDLHEHLKARFRTDNEAARRIVGSDREHLRSLIKLMQRDHYLRQDGSGAYRFRFDLIRRWWRIDLGIV